jgi:hypothetical protein
MDWIKLLQQGGIAAVVVLAVGYFFAKYMWPFVINEVKESRETLKITLREMTEIRIDAVKQLSESKENDWKKFDARLRERDEAFLKGLSDIKNELKEEIKKK